MLSAWSRWWRVGQRHTAALFALVCLMAYLVAAAGHAQSRPVVLEVGFAGEIVANAWNPLRLTLRDQPAAELTLRIDQGDLRQGEQVIHYRVPLSGGSGLRVFEDDLFIPAWRSFTWSVQSSGRVLASGAIDRRQLDHRPLDLVISRETGAWRGHYPDDARIVDLLPNELPERTAAFDGVRSLVLDGTTAPPRAEAFVAATVAGVTTILPEQLPNSYRDLVALSRQTEQQLGLGQLVRIPPDALQTTLTRSTRVEYSELLSSLSTPNTVRPQTFQAIGILVVATVLYTLIVTSLIRFGQAPGVVAALSLTLFASLASWSYLRPRETSILHGQALSIGAGGLALVLERRTFVQLPGGTTRLTLAAHPVDQPHYTRRGDTLELTLPRWSTTTLHLKPRLERAVLQWRDGALVNRGTVVLTEVYVTGVGPQEDLGPGGSHEVHTAAPGSGVTMYETLVPLLPPGTALARQEERVVVALPEGSAREQLSGGQQ